MEAWKVDMLDEMFASRAWSEEEKKKIHDIATADPDLSNKLKLVKAGVAWNLACRLTPEIRARWAFDIR